MVLYKIDATIKEKINALAWKNLFIYSFIKMSIILFLSIVILIVQR